MTFTDHIEDGTPSAPFRSGWSSVVLAKDDQLAEPVSVEGASHSETTSLSDVEAGVSGEADGMAGQADVVAGDADATMAGEADVVAGDTEAVMAGEADDVAGEAAQQAEGDAATDLPVQAPDDQWREIWSMFVDDPRASVALAGAMVAKASESFAALARERQALQPFSWQEHDADTEQLRTALQGYRALWRTVVACQRDFEDLGHADANGHDATAGD